MEGMTLPLDNRTGPNCGITAVAIMAGVSFEAAWEAVRAAAGFTHKRWAGKSHWAHRTKALASFSVHLTGVPVPRMTLETFVRCFAKAGVRYMVRTTGHVQVVKNRHVTDQHGCVPIGEYWGRRKFVTMVQKEEPAA